MTTDTSGHEMALAQAEAMIERQADEIARLRDELTAARKTNSEWLAANGPGGWINDLRVENERLRTDIAHWQSETQAWVKTCNRATESRGELHAESERLRDELEKLRKPAKWRTCATHGDDKPNVWGCPECLRELRDENARLLAERDDADRMQKGE